ncbi:putative filament-like plant protein [Dioscorea sansibarensis]
MMTQGELHKQLSSNNILVMDENSMSASSHSQRFSDDLEMSRDSLSDASPNHAKSPDGSSDVAVDEADGTVKSLTEKLTSALSSIKAKEDLVKQHAKVAEEAVLGWEKAETEVAVLKQQLDSVSQKKSVLEDRVEHLDGALKECVRQLRQSREEQEQKINEALIQKSSDWESEKFELENQLVELQAQLEGKDTEAFAFNAGLQSKLETAEKDNSILKVELLTLFEDLQLRMLERDLSTRAAETASKQHLESIKKVARLEAECLRLRAVARKTPSDHKLNFNSGYVESLTDSQSDSGERLLAVDNEQSCSDSWASALIAELDQFKNDKVNVKNFAVSSAEIDLMDDFLEMERLAAILPEAECGSSCLDLEADSERAVTRDCHYKHELELLQLQIKELADKVEKTEMEKAALEKVLSETQNQLDISHKQLIVAEVSLAELQKQLDAANCLMDAMEVKRKDLESQLELAHSDAGNLRENVIVLQEKAKAMSPLSACLGTSEAKREELESQLDLAYSEIKMLQEKVIMLEVEVAERTALAGEFTAKFQFLETVEATQNTLESLKLAQLDVEELHEKVRSLEGRLEQERKCSAKFAANANMEIKRREMVESQLKLVQLDVEELHEKVRALEGTLEQERECSAKFAANADMEIKKREMVESQLNTADLEVMKLHEKVNVLERKVEEEMTLHAESAAKCSSLEEELTRKRREAENIRSANTNGELKLKQEKELVLAAGKLAECQKTIASLSEQLRSLTSIEELAAEAAKPEVNGVCMGHNDEELGTLYCSNSSESLDFVMLPNGVYRKS